MMQSTLDRLFFPFKKSSRILPPAQFVLLNLVLEIGHFLVLLNAGAYLPMLPNVAGKIGNGLAYAVWGQTDYFTAMGAAFLVTRDLMRRFGPKVVTISAYLLFATASLMAALATDHLFLYTALRVTQGLAAGMSIIPSFFLLLEYYRIKQQKIALALWGFAVFIPYSLGPVIGGWFAYVLGDFRLLFITSFFVAIFVAGTLWALLADWDDESDRAHSLIRPVISFLLFFGAALALQQVFNIGLLSDLVNRLRELWQYACIAGLLGWLFWVTNSGNTNPLVRLSLFRHTNYGLGMLLLNLGFMGLQGATVQYIIRFQVVEGFTPWHVGLLYLPIFVFSKPFSVIAQRLLHRGLDPRILASLSFAIVAICFYWIAEYNRPATWESMLWPQLWLGMAMGLFFVSMTAISIAYVPKQDQMHAVDLLNTIRNLCAGLAITFSDIAWDWMFAYEQNRATSPDTTTMQVYTAEFQSAPMVHTLHEHIMLNIARLTFNDLFYSLSMLFATLTCLIWLTQHTPKISGKKLDFTMLETLGEEP